MSKSKDESRYNLIKYIIEDYKNHDGIIIKEPPEEYLVEKNICQTMLKAESNNSKKNRSR